MSAQIVIVAAMDKFGAIGKQNEIPWSIPSEMKHFRKTTLNGTVLMGRKTAESIGMLLPKRKNLVLTTQDTAPYEGQIVVRNLEDALEKTTTPELFIIGGAQIYEMFLDKADRMILTHIETTVVDPDAFFPSVDLSKFYVEESIGAKNDEECAYTITHYLRKTSTNGHDASGHLSGIRDETLRR